MNHSETTIQTYNACADQYKKEISPLKIYNETYEYFASLLAEKAEVLELGCGPGNASKFIKNIRSDISITGIDLAPAMIKLAKEELPDDRFFVDDVRNIGTYKNKYDAILGAFCVPYLNKEELETMIVNCQKLLNPDGVLYLSVVGGDHTQSGPVTESFTNGMEVYVFFYPYEHIWSLLHENNFVEKKKFDTPFPLSDGSFSSDYVLICQKQGS